MRVGQGSKCFEKGRQLAQALDSCLHAKRGHQHHSMLLQQEKRGGQCSSGARACSWRPWASVERERMSSASLEMACCGERASAWSMAGHGALHRPGCTVQPCLRARSPTAAAAPAPPRRSTRPAPEGLPRRRSRPAARRRARQSRQSCRCGRWCRRLPPARAAARSPSALRATGRDARHAWFGGRAVAARLRRGASGQRCGTTRRHPSTAGRACTDTCTPSMRRSQPSISCRLSPGLRLGLSRHSSAAGQGQAWGMGPAAGERVVRALRPGAGARLHCTAPPTCGQQRALAVHVDRAALHNDGAGEAAHALHLRRPQGRRVEGDSRRWAQAWAEGSDGCRFHPALSIVPGCRSQHPMPPAAPEPASPAGWRRPRRRPAASWRTARPPRRPRR